ncbi:hypothetical protein HDU88_005265 [Geranomyces variabilis]|nr:hypothetical protein HDU88_005265 [Geranomyces variabilis]
MPNSNSRQRRNENELRQALSASGQLSAHLRHTAAFAAREAGMPVDRRLLKSAELSSFVQDGRLLSNRCVTTTDPRFGPAVCTTNKEYWGIETFADWAAWAQHEMDFYCFDEQVPNNLGLMRENGWNESADQILQCREMFAAVGMPRPGN